jgi:hypothetical protein
MPSMNFNESSFRAVSRASTDRCINNKNTIAPDFNGMLVFVVAI